MAVHHGSKLKWLVDNQSLTNDELAKEWGISPATLYNWFNQEELNSKKIRPICKIMGWDYEKEFLGIDRETKTKKIELTYEDQISILKRENELLKEQVRQLKEINELIKVKEVAKRIRAK